MCLNCGCGDPADDKGKPQNITIRHLRDAAAANGQTVRESAQHIQETVAAYERQGSAPAEGSSHAEGRGQSGDGLAQPAGSEPAPAASKGTPGTES
jgi:hypothetical protein